MITAAPVNFPSVVELGAAVGRLLDLEPEGNLLHAWRVALVAARMAERLSPSEAPSVFLAGMLADAGALSFPTHIVHEWRDAPAVLTQKSRVGFFFHPVVAAEWLATLPGMGRIATLVAQHHESPNGLGYPRGLRGPQIELGARILRMADLVDRILRDEAPVYPQDLLQSLVPLWGEDVDGELLPALTDLIRQDLPLALLQQPERLIADVERLVAGWAGLTWFGEAQEWERFFAGLGDLLEMRAGRTIGGHAARVREMAERIAVALHLDDDTRRLVRWAAALQNMGEIRYRGTLDTKRGKLESTERRLVREHPEVGFDLLAGLSGMAEVARLVRHHHENYEGSGYPAGLVGTEIPLGSRLIRLCDACAAMSSERPYQRRREWKRVLGELRRQSGRQFDPQLVLVALDIFAE